MAQIAAVAVALHLETLCGELAALGVRIEYVRVRNADGVLIHWCPPPLDTGRKRDYTVSQSSAVQSSDVTHPAD